MPATLDQALAAACDTRCLEIGHNILDRVPKVFSRLFPNRAAILIADPRTFAAAGENVLHHLRAQGIPMRAPLLLDAPDLYAESRFVEPIQNALADHDAIPIAVGSGTINDLVKLAAHRCGRRYLCVATAASMDGYTAFGASITHRCSKQTFDCPAPLAVVADLEVIARAPAEMTGWGYADLSAKITAGADWLLADALGVEPVDALAWDIAQSRLHEALGIPLNIAALVEGLMLAGFAMQHHKTSRPASGAEHQFSHLWDMQHHMHEGHAPSHGAKVGIATLAVTAFYEALLDIDLSQINTDALAAAWPDDATWLARAEACFADPELLAVARRELAAKAVTRDELHTQLKRLQTVWPDLRLRLKRQLLPLPELKQRLQTAGAPVEPEQIGISRARLHDSFLAAYFVRRRFTVLDFAMRAGVFESAVCQYPLHRQGQPCARVWRRPGEELKQDAGCRCSHPHP